MTTPAIPPPTSRRPPWLLIEAGLLVALLATWLLLRPPEAAAEVHWLGGAAAAAIEPFATLPAELPLQVEIELARPMHVYVASHDMTRGTIAMLPSTVLRSDVPASPLPAGRHRLPGTHDAIDLQWHAGDGVGPTSFIVIASADPLPELHDVLQRCRQMGNAAFPKRAVLGTYAPPEGMAATPRRHELPHPVLQAAHALLDPLHDGPMVPLDGHDGVLAKVLRVSTATPAPTDDEDATRARVRARLGPLDGAFELESQPPAAGR